VVDDDSPEAAAIGQTLTRYFQAINDGEYDEAWAQYSERLRARVPRDRFAEGVRSSYDVDVTVHTVDLASGGAATAFVTFTSFQRPEFAPEGRAGEQCTDWSLDYAVVLERGRWMIDGSAAHEGTKSAPCADDEAEGD
jgi:hypothetical protein